MRLYNETSIKALNEEKEELENKEKAIQSLGQELTRVKFSDMQKDIIISNLGQEISKAKLDIMQLKGGQ